METLLKSLKLLCPSLDYGALASVYFTAKLIIAYTTDGNYNTAFTSVALQKALYTYRDVVSPMLNDEHTDTWCELCNELQQTGLDQDYRSFFQLIIPFAVHDWATFYKHWAVSDVGRMLVALCLILRNTPPESLEVSDNWLHDKFRAEQHLFKKVGLDFDAYAQCWRAVHLTSLASSDHTPSGPVSRAARLYHSMQLPMTDLLSDYAAIYLQEGEMAQRIATRGNRKRNRTTPAAEHGRSEQDLELERTLLSLAQETPTDVIRGLFYPPARNDAGFECTYLIQRFRAEYAPDERVLIVNPSPDMLLCLATDSFACSNYSFLVSDKTLANLYRKQFGKDYTFLSADMLEKCGCPYDRILITSRDQPLEPILVCLQWAASDAHITALIPEVSLSVMHKRLQTGGAGIHAVLSVPSNSTQSAPRKKVLIEARTDWTANGCLIHRGICDEYQTLFGIHKHCFWAPYTWLTSTMTIADMRKTVQTQHSDHRSQEPLVIRYSPEISFRLTLQRHRKGAVAGRICYRKILRPEDRHRKRGDRTTPIIEKGLRKETEDDVIKAVEHVALDERIVPAVITDILDYYSGRLHELSLKSAWYCLRPVLQAKYGYDDKTVIEMLSANNNALSLIPIGTGNPKVFDDAMDNLLPEEFPRKRFWKQLHLIIKTAQAEGYISFDPLEGFMAVVERRLSKRQQDVRNALTKKIFEPAEETQLLRPFFQGEKPNYDWMKSDPLALVLPLAMMAVPVLREAVVLRWADMVSNDGLGTWHLRMTSYLRENGSLYPLIDCAVERYRCVPLAPILAQLLLEYKSYLMKTYEICEEELAQYPILMENHSALRNRKTNIRPGILKSASTKLREHIAQLQIPVNEVVLPDGASEHVTDLNRYGGNILYTNLKYHLRHICRFGEGELCYCLGRKAPDTFSAHYCAYDHPLLLHRMAMKLDRWTGTITEDCRRPVQPTYRILDIQKSIDLVYAGQGFGSAHCDLIMTSEKDNSGSIAIELESRYGYSGQIVTISTEGVKPIDGDKY